MFLLRSNLRDYSLLCICCVTPVNLDYLSSYQRIHLSLFHQNEKKQLWCSCIPELQTQQLHGYFNSPVACTTMILRSSERRKSLLKGECIFRKNSGQKMMNMCQVLRLQSKIINQANSCKKWPQCQFSRLVFSNLQTLHIWFIHMSRQRWLLVLPSLTISIHFTLLNDISLGLFLKKKHHHKLGRNIS